MRAVAQLDRTVGWFRWGTGSVGVTAGAGCTWSATKNAAWITFTGATSGTGNGSVPYSVAANPSTSPRSGTLTIAGLTYTVNQAALSCSYTVSPTSQAVVAGGGTGSTTVTAPAGCAWTGVSNNTSWLTVTSGASGSGPGTVAFSASANPNTSPRTGTITIAGQTFTVNQAAAACTYALLPTSQSVVAGGGTGSTSVTTPAGCAWTGVSNNTGWLTVTSGASGSGAGTVAFSASANPNTSPRTGTITIAGQTFTVNQAAAACTLYAAVDEPIGRRRGRHGVDDRDGAGRVCVDGREQQHVVADGDERGERQRARHRGVQCVGQFEYEPTLWDDHDRGPDVHRQPGGRRLHLYAAVDEPIGRRGGRYGSTSVTAPAGCAWTGVSNNTSWLTVTSGASGSGAGTVAFSASANPNTSPRTGTITIAGQTFTVNQAAAACTYTLQSTSQSVVAGGGTGRRP